MMNKFKKIEFDEKCQSCKGTGLYKGMAERDCFAVICSKCEGTGKYHFVHEYEEFTGREEREGIAKVIQCNPGIVVGGSLDFGGMSYQEWMSGKQFDPGMEMREYVCPCWWYQVADYSKKPKWKECLVGGRFSSCPSFGNKEQCWKRWDREYRKKEVRQGGNK